MIQGIPYWRLSSFYFFYFCLVGTLNPYLGLYLSDIGLSAKQIGAVAGVLLGTKIIAPNFWSWLCDHTGRRLLVIAFGGFMAMLSFTGLFFWSAFLPIIIVTFFYSFFWNAILPQFDSLTLQHLDKNSHKYSQVRVWGSLGFIVAVVVLGWLFDRISIEYLIPISWLFLLFIWFSTLIVREPSRRAHTEQTHTHWLQLLKQPPVIAFFSAAFLLQFSFGGYYSFFSLHLESFHYSRTLIGLLWALGVLCEVGLFMVMHKVIAAVSLSSILFWSLLLTGIRWLIIAYFADSLIVMVFAQSIHALSFGAAHAGCIEMIRRFFQGPNAGQGQALYSAFGFGAGGASGAIVSGFLWEISAELLFTVSAVSAFIAAAVVWFGLTRSQVDHLG
ncbi:MAG: PPP family 3-phenylpropionic acid transporter [Cellvibrionaceae bacterium]